MALPRSIPLLNEFLSLPRWSNEQFDWLRKRSIPVQVIAGDETSGQLPVRFAPVVFLPGGRFEFAHYCQSDDDKAVKALIIAVQHGCQVRDLAAWHPSDNRLATLEGRAFALGEEQIYAPNLGRRPLPVWRTPLEWLQFNRLGIVLLDNRNAWHRLDHLPGLVAESAAHAEELARLVWNPHRPVKIFTVGTVKEAA